MNESFAELHQQTKLHIVHAALSAVQLFDGSAVFLARKETNQIFAVAEPS